MRLPFLPFLLAVLLLISCNSSEGDEEGAASDTTINGSTQVDSTRPQAGGNIRVESPRPGDTLGSTSFTIRGTARTFEGNVIYRLVYDSVLTLVDGFTTATAAEVGTFGPFSVKVDYTTDWGGAAVLEVYEQDAESGKEVNMVRIPIVLPSPPSGKGKQIYSYFPNGAIEGGAETDCQAVYPVRRELPERSVALARGALYHLLKGPTEEEAKQGYTTMLPQGLRLQSLRLDSGIVRLEFSHELEEIKKQCTAAMVRAQIEQTLAQFQTVNAVAINVGGKNWGRGR